jgi:hypothetical protein
MNGFHWPLTCHITETPPTQNALISSTSRSTFKFHVHRRIDKNLSLRPSLSVQRKRRAISTGWSARRNSQLHQMWPTQGAQQRQHSTLFERPDVFLF